MLKKLTVESKLNSKDPVLYDLYEKLKQWAKSLWTDHNDVHEQIRHGITHSEALMGYANTVLQKKLKDDYLDEKELFLFASAVFLHDIGMQTGWKEQLGIKGDRGNLNTGERKQIRMNHASTSGAVIRSFKIDLPDFLDKNLSPRQKGILCKDLNDRLAFIAESHNVKEIAAYLKKEVALRFPENTLKVDFLAALLQFCDTMHMDKSRLNEEKFLDEVAKWEAGKPLEAAYEVKDWQRFFQSYYVESARVLPHEKSDAFKIQLEVRFNVEESEEFRNRFLNIYKGRIDRRNHDCLEILNWHGIHFLNDNPFNILEPETAKIKLPKKIIDLFGEFEAAAKIPKKNAPSKIVPIESLPNRDTAEVVSHYCTWLRESTCTYVIPGIKNPPIPVAKCWLPLSAIELPIDNPPPQSPREALDFYMKAGKNKTGREKTYDAEWMGVGLRRVVLVGGPGSGKSLLLQRIAHREAQAGRTVLLTKLKFIASEMCTKKMSFEESLTSVSMAGCRFNDFQKRIIAQESTLLLLDGLDECGGQRNTIAADIVKLSIAHPELTIIITTRPVGHVPACLPQWPHYLLNTDNTYTHQYSEFAVDGVCQEIFKDQKDKVEQVEKRLSQIIFSDGWRNKDKDYKFVRDVPLLFSFVISLAVHGCDIPEKRMELYRDVIKLLAKDDVQDRGAETKIDNCDAYMFLHYLAWLLMENPTQEFDTLIQKTGELLAAELGVKIAAARRLSEQAFRFWEERRLLERLHHGTEELVTFMHLGFCEYAAAQHLTTLSPEEIKAWVVATRNDPRWKEVYLNAASLGLGQIIVETLLELDNPVPPDTDEAIFAAEIAAIADNIDEGVQQNLLRSIMHRITSDYPTRTCAAAESLLPLARKYPKLVGAHLKPLLSYEDEWPRFAALALCLESGKEYVNLQELLESYPDLFPQSKFPSSSSSPFGGFDLRALSEPHDLKMAIVIGATKILLSEGVSPDLLTRITSMYEKHLSMHQTSELSRVLKESGIPEVIEIAAENEKKYRDGFSIPKMLKVDEGGLGFLDLLLAACSMDSESISTDEERPFIHIGKLAQVLRLGEMTYSWSEWLTSGQEQQTHLAIRGAMLAAGIEPLELCRDIVAAKMILENDEYSSLFSLLPDFPVDEDWSKCFGMCISDPKLLASAITHPCEAVGFAAAEIIAAGIINEPLKAALTNVLSISRFDALYVISLIADHIWGNDVCEVVLSRLEKELTSGCKYLIKKIPVYSGRNFDDRILEVIKRALIAECEGVAEAATELCLEYIPKELLHAELKTALFYWKENEKPYPTSGGVIPPSPRASLVKALEQRDGLSIDELIELYEDVRSDVKDVAKSALLLLAKKNPVVVTRILDLVEGGRFRSKTLWLLMDLPLESLLHEQHRLLGFLNSENPDIQVVMIAALKRHRLLGDKDAINLLRQKLDSPNVNIREAASRAIKHIGLSDL